jgi:hypothetical protein
LINLGYAIKFFGENWNFLETFGSPGEIFWNFL